MVFRLNPLCLLPLLPLLLLLSSLPSLSSAAAVSSWNSGSNGAVGYDYADYGTGRYESRSGKSSDEYGRGAVPQAPPRSEVFESIILCESVCALPCPGQLFHFGDAIGDKVMYSCAKLKPPKKSSAFFQSLSSSSFYLSLFIIGCIVVAILVLLTLCFCCSYCCRSGHGDESSRGSSKQALAHNEDGEFKEYLNGNGLSNGNGHHSDDMGAMKRERDFTRRPRPMIV